MEEHAIQYGIKVYPLTNNNEVKGPFFNFSQKTDKITHGVLSKLKGCIQFFRSGEGVRHYHLTGILSSSVSSTSGSQHSLGPSCIENKQKQNKHFAQFKSFLRVGSHDPFFCLITFLSLFQLIEMLITNLWIWIIIGSKNWILWTRL